MHQSLLGIAVAMALFGASAATSAQTWRSFDPDPSQKVAAQTMCEKELPPPEEAAPGERTWAMDCADLDIKIENSEFDALRAAAKKHGNAELNAFNALVSAFESYKELHLDIDTKGCGGGNGCGAMMALEEAEVNYDFLLIAEGFRGAGFPSFSASEAGKADAALNSAYNHDLLGYPDHCPENSDDMENMCVTQREFRGMERTWIRYRDAWVTYGAIKWPKVTADSWRCYLTKQHTGNGGELQIGIF